MQALPYAREIRFRCLATMPGVAIAGAAMGAAVATSTGQPLLDAALWFAAAMCAGSYLSAILEAATLRVLRFSPGTFNGDVVGFGWDLAMGAIAGAFLSTTLPVSLLESAGAASAILFLQRLVLEKILIGNLIGDTFVALLQGGGGTVADYSRAAALAARGDFIRSRAEYEAAIAVEPKNPRAYLALAHMLRGEAHDYAAAAETLARVLHLDRIDPQTRLAATRELVELYMYRLNDPGRATSMLARYIHERGGEENVEWARTMQRHAKEQIVR